MGRDKLPGTPDPDKPDTRPIGLSPLFDTIGPRNRGKRPDFAPFQRSGGIEHNGRHPVIINDILRTTWGETTMGRASWWLGLAAAALAGCSEPPAVVPAVPPGVEVERALPPPGEEQQSEAIGENPSRQVAKPPPREVAPDRTPEELAKIQPTAPPTPVGEERATDSGVKYLTLQRGDGPMARKGLFIKIKFTGRLGSPRGPRFDSSDTHHGVDSYGFKLRVDPRKGQPIGLEYGSYVPGWSDGLDGMRVGEVRRVTIPPELGFGSKDQLLNKVLKVPPDSTLVYEVELLHVNER
jgi:FKBP-type peptidyl-prolyl cis-trans isomerase FkpA